jgi:hypothetical protein
VARYLVDADIAVTCYTQDTAGNLQNADTTPVLTIEGPWSTVTPTLTNGSAGEYTATFTPTDDGIWVGTFTATVDTVDYVTVTRWVVHDGQDEANRWAFPQGLQSWVSAV